MSRTSQKTIAVVEVANRSVVGYAEDYPAGFAAEAHSHPRAHLIYAVSGVMHVETDAASYIIPPTTALLMPADILHSVHMDGPVAMRALFVRGAAASQFFASCKVIAVTPLLRELTVAACEEPIDWQEHGRGFHIASLALNEIERSSVLSLELPLARDIRLKRVAAALKSDPSSKRSLGDWAEFANTTERTLARLFRKDTGLSFRQWRLQAQLTAAISALSTGASLKQAASISGFNSQSAFGVAFRKFFGFTPGRVRTASVR